jgi:hypothetical protein
MNSKPVVTEDKDVHNLTEVFEELPTVNNQEAIVVNGRGYENNDKNKREIHTLVDVIEDTQTADNVYENIMKQAAEIAERIARDIIPDIAERVIKEEIEKLKKIDIAE